MKIHIVEGTSGSYSDRSEWTVCAFVSEEKAEQLAKDLNELVKFNVEFNKRKRIEFDETYTDECPKAPERPYASKELHDLQNRCSHGGGFPEDKAAFRKAQAEHMKNIHAWDAKNTEHNKIAHTFYLAKVAAEKDWFTKNYNPPEHLKEATQYLGYDVGYFSGHDNRYYSYDTELHE